VLWTIIRDFQPHIAQMPLRQLALKRNARVLDLFLIDESFLLRVARNW
jgi:hypothetical protein